MPPSSVVYTNQRTTRDWPSVYLVHRVLDFDWMNLGSPDYSTRIEPSGFWTYGQDQEGRCSTRLKPFRKKDTRKWVVCTAIRNPDISIYFSVDTGVLLTSFSLHFPSVLLCMFDTIFVSVLFRNRSFTISPTQNFLIHSRLGYVCHLCRPTWDPIPVNSGSVTGSPYLLVLNESLAV